MSGKLRFGITIASLTVTAALVWVGVSLTMLFMHWTGEHQTMAKAMQLLPAFTLPIVALILYRRRKRITLLA